MSILGVDDRRLRPKYEIILGIDSSDCVTLTNSHWNLRGGVVGAGAVGSQTHFPSRQCYNKIMYSTVKYYIFWSEDTKVKKKETIYDNAKKIGI